MIHSPPLQLSPPLHYLQCSVPGGWDWREGDNPFAVFVNANDSPFALIIKPNFTLPSTRSEYIIYNNPTMPQTLLGYHGLRTQCHTPYSRVVCIEHEEKFAKVRQKS